MMVMQYNTDQVWPAPAKLNLMLRIVGRRDDGYHLLQSVFQFLDYCDYLQFRVRSDGVIRRVIACDGIPEASDLTLRAAYALRQFGDQSLGVDIALQKRLPIGGGLGGGSSDAATTLIALNRMWNIDLPIEQLMELAVLLGADVPVFVKGEAAWAEGIGDILVPVQLAEPWYVIVVPPCQVLTAKVFSDPQLTRDSVPITIADFMLGGNGNDCEAVVCRQYPAVATALKWLSDFAVARMTGTGSCVFAEFATQCQAREVVAQAPATWRVLVAGGQNRSQLLNM